MSTLDQAPPLLGRSSESAALDQLVASVRAGPSRALVLRGEAGVGKSALLDSLARRASGCAIARAAGVESEMELMATGETVRKRTVESLDDLTPQETQIAQLAAGGRTNPEIGAQLFLSPRTVEWHLGKVFSKLGVRSRRELRTALPDRGAAVVLA